MVMEVIFGDEVVGNGMDMEEGQDMVKEWGMAMDMAEQWVMDMVKEWGMAMDMAEEWVMDMIKEWGMAMDMAEEWVMDMVKEWGMAMDMAEEWVTYMVTGTRDRMKYIQNGTMAQGLLNQMTGWKISVAIERVKRFT